MPITIQTKRNQPVTRVVFEFLAATWAKFVALFTGPRPEADRRAAEKKRQKEIRRRLRGL